MGNTSEKKYLTFMQKVGYGVGDLGSNYCWTFVSSFVLIYCTNTLGISAGVIGVIMMLSKFLDGISDVIMGRIIDKTKSKMGKARFWYALSAFPVALFTFLLFNIPGSFSENTQYVYIFIVYTLMGVVFYTMSNIAYAVMQGDDGSRSIYAISLSGWTPTNMTQQGCWDNITAEGFATAVHFAFHETYPYVFYSNGSTLYAYQMEGGGSVSSVNLPGEEITMVKITSTGDREDWNEYILVGSYRDDASDDNGGILRMYTFDRSSNTFVEAARYEGFAKIVDVAYRGLDDE